MKRGLKERLEKADDVNVCAKPGHVDPRIFDAATSIALPGLWLR